MMLLMGLDVDAELDTAGWTEGQEDNQTVSWGGRQIQWCNQGTGRQGWCRQGSEDWEGCRSDSEDSYCSET